MGASDAAKRPDCLNSKHYIIDKKEVGAHIQILSGRGDQIKAFQVDEAKGES